MSAPGTRLLARNKRARAEYIILETLEAGLSLTGTEVKFIRAGNVNFADSYISVKGREAHIESLHIAPYEHAGRFNHEPLRRRRLLLKAAELRRLVGKVSEKGLTLIPLALYTRKHLIKLEIGLARGKKLHDKRQDLAQREARREIERAMKERHRYPSR